MLYRPLLICSALLAFGCDDETGSAPGAPDAGMDATSEAGASCSVDAEGFTMVADDLPEGSFFVPPHAKGDLLLVVRNRTKTDPVHVFDPERCALVRTFVPETPLSKPIALGKRIASLVEGGVQITDGDDGVDASRLIATTASPRGMHADDTWLYVVTVLLGNEQPEIWVERIERARLNEPFASTERWVRLQNDREWTYADIDGSSDILLVSLRLYMPDVLDTVTRFSVDLETGSSSSALSPRTLDDRDQAWEAIGGRQGYVQTRTELRFFADAMVDSSVVLQRDASTGNLAAAVPGFGLFLSPENETLSAVSAQGGAPVVVARNMTFGTSHVAAVGPDAYFLNGLGELRKKSLVP